MSNGRYQNDYEPKPTMKNAQLPDRSAKALFMESCFGGGAGASMGLIRHIFKRFDTDGDGFLSKDELKTGLAGRNHDVKHFDAFWDVVDRDHDGRVTVIELARALAEDNFKDAPQLNADESSAPAGSLSAR